jgi:hypothetical protein
VARPLRTHDRQYGAHHVYHAVKVRSQLAFNLGAGHLFKMTKQAVAGVVDRDIDPAEPLDSFSDGRFRLCLVGHVQPDKREVLARNVVEGVAHFVEIPSGRHNALTGSQGGLRDSGADATTGTGDKPDLAHGLLPSIRPRGIVEPPQQFNNASNKNCSDTVVRPACSSELRELLFAG